MFREVGCRGDQGRVGGFFGRGEGEGREVVAAYGVDVVVARGEAHKGDRPFCDVPRYHRRACPHREPREVVADLGGRVRGARAEGEGR